MRNGTLQSAQNFATGFGAHSVAVGDVNNDGKCDIVTAKQRRRKRAAG